MALEKVALQLRTTHQARGRGRGRGRGGEGVKRGGAGFMRLEIISPTETLFLSDL
jgi:hypothetical protein